MAEIKKVKIRKNDDEDDVKEKITKALEKKYSASTHACNDCNTNTQNINNDSLW